MARAYALELRGWFMCFRVYGSGIGYMFWGLEVGGCIPQF